MTEEAIRETLTVVWASSTGAWATLKLLENKREELKRKFFPDGMTGNDGDEDDIKDRDAWERLDRKLQPNAWNIQKISTALGSIAIISFLILVEGYG